MSTRPPLLLDAIPNLLLPTRSDVPRVLQCVVKRIPTRETKRGGHGGPSQVIAAFVPYRWKSSSHTSSSQSSADAKITILYSHGNAVDLGQMLPVYRWGAQARSLAHALLQS